MHCPSSEASKENYPGWNHFPRLQQEPELLRELLLCQVRVLSHMLNWVRLRSHHSVGLGAGCIIGGAISTSENVSQNTPDTTFSLTESSPDPMTA